MIAANVVDGLCEHKTGYSLRRHRDPQAPLPRRADTGSESECSVGCPRGYRVRCFASSRVRLFLAREATASFRYPMLTSSAPAAVLAVVAVVVAV
jgi:hypothetical protein